MRRSHACSLSMAVTSLGRPGNAHHILEGEQAAQAVGGGAIHVGRAEFRHPVPKSEYAPFPYEYHVDDSEHKGCTSPIVLARRVFRAPW